MERIGSFGSGQRVEPREPLAGGANALDGLSSLELIVRLYDGAIDFVGRACTNEEPEARRRALARARAVVDTLQDHLDLDAGGDVALRLSELYELVRERLATASANASGAVADAAARDLFETACGEAIAVLAHVKTGWEELALDPAIGGA